MTRAPFLPALLAALLLLPASPGTAKAGMARAEAAERLEKAPAPARLRLLFEASDASLDIAERDVLAALTEELSRQTGLIEIRAYGGEPGDTSSTARRLSLKRARAVRAFLLDRGVAPERLIVRALGGIADQGPPDRVDIVDFTP